MDPSNLKEKEHARLEALWKRQPAIKEIYTKQLQLRALAKFKTRKMKLIQRRAYDFRSFENYRLRVIAQCG